MQRPPVVFDVPRPGQLDGLPRNGDIERFHVDAPTQLFHVVARASHLDAQRGGSFARIRQLNVETLSERRQIARFPACAQRQRAAGIDDNGSRCVEREIWRHETEGDLTTRECHVGVEPSQIRRAPSCGGERELAMRRRISERAFPIERAGQRRGHRQIRVVCRARYRTDGNVLDRPVRRVRLARQVGGSARGNPAFPDRDRETVDGHCRRVDACVRRETVDLLAHDADVFSFGGHGGPRVRTRARDRCGEVQRPVNRQRRWKDARQVHEIVCRDRRVQLPRNLVRVRAPVECASC